MTETILNNGDCTKLLKDCPFKFDLILTDPPYNISQENRFSTMKTGDRQGIDFGEWDWHFDLTGWIEIAFKLLKDDGSIIIFCSVRNTTTIINELERLGGGSERCDYMAKN